MHVIQEAAPATRPCDWCEEPTPLDELVTLPTALDWCDNAEVCESCAGPTWPAAA